MGRSYNVQKDLVRFENNVIESTFVEINSRDGRKIIVGSFYRPPNSSPSEFLTKLNEITSKINKKAVRLMAQLIKFYKFYYLLYLNKRWLNSQ